MSMSTRMPIRTGSNGSPCVCRPAGRRIDGDPLDGLLADPAAALVPALVLPLARSRGVDAELRRSSTRPVLAGDPVVDRSREHPLGVAWPSSLPRSSATLPL